MSKKGIKFVCIGNLIDHFRLTRSSAFINAGLSFSESPKVHCARLSNAIPFVLIGLNLPYLSRAKLIGANLTEDKLTEADLSDLLILFKSIPRLETNYDF